MSLPDFALVGPGRLGTRIARRLVEAGYPCRVLRGHHRPPRHLENMVPGCTVFDTPGQPRTWPRVALVLVTVPDREIPRAARSLAAQGLGRHPLQSFPSGEDPVELRDVWCALEGDEPAVEAGGKLCTALGMRPWRIAPGAKARYHAAASLAANLSHVLVVAAGRILAETGIPAVPPASALGPLMATTLHAALEAEDLQHLTGPMARGDLETMARHFEVLPSELAEAYRDLAQFVANWERRRTRGSIDPRHGDV